jgi:hypothetical protein
LYKEYFILLVYAEPARQSDIGDCRGEHRIMQGELCRDLADAKLALDKVRPEDSRLDSGGEAIMGFDADPATLEQLRSAVPPLEWSWSETPPP